MACIQLPGTAAEGSSGGCANSSHLAGSLARLEEMGSLPCRARTASTCLRTRGPCCLPSPPLPVGKLTLPLPPVWGARCRRAQAWPYAEPTRLAELFLWGQLCPKVPTAQPPEFSPLLSWGTRRQHEGLVSGWRPALTGPWGKLQTGCFQEIRGAPVLAGLLQAPAEISLWERNLNCRCCCSSCPWCVDW